MNLLRKNRLPLSPSPTLPPLFLPFFATAGNYSCVTPNTTHVKAETHHPFFFSTLFFFLSFLFFSPLFLSNDVPLIPFNISWYIPKRNATGVGAFSSFNQISLTMLFITCLWDTNIIYQRALTLFSVVFDRKNIGIEFQQQAAKFLSADVETYRLYVYHVRSRIS